MSKEPAVLWVPILSVVYCWACCCPKSNWFLQYGETLGDVVMIDNKYAYQNLSLLLGFPPECF